MTTETTPPADELEPDAGAPTADDDGAQEEAPEAPSSPDVSDELAAALEAQAKRFSFLEEAVAGLTARVHELEQAPAAAAPSSSPPIPSPAPPAAAPDAEVGEPGEPCPRCARAELREDGTCPRCGYAAPALLEE